MRQLLFENQHLRESESNHDISKIWVVRQILLKNN